MSGLSCAAVVRRPSYATHLPRLPVCRLHPASHPSQSPALLEPNHFSKSGDRGTEPPGLKGQDQKRTDDTGSTANRYGLPLHPFSASSIPFVSTSLLRKLCAALRGTLPCPDNVPAKEQYHHKPPGNLPLCCSIEPGLARHRFNHGLELPCLCMWFKALFGNERRSSKPSTFIAAYSLP